MVIVHDEVIYIFQMMAIQR